MKSAPTKRFEPWRAVSISTPASARPSPGAIRSVIAYTRFVEAISVVRSGVQNPRWIARPASISSEAITMSTSPGVGKRLSTGSVLASAAASPSRGGNSST
jgi:hypothetical protein